MLFSLLIVATMASVVSLSGRFFSPQELQDGFEDGQKLYALGDYDKAIGHYEGILDTKSNLMIDVEDVDVTVDEFILPVRVAAAYQLANSYNKLGLDKLLRVSFLRREKKEAEAEKRYEEALADLNASLEYFARISEDEEVDERTRVMAQFQTLETNYKLQKFDQVIHEGETLLKKFPNSVYETAAYYNIGWSYFELERYQEAVDSFNQVLTLSPRGSHADRSFYQVAESFDRLEEYDQALSYLNRLIKRHDFSEISEQELIEMASMKLKGLVEETTRELVAKAQLKKGDIYAHRGDIDQALAAYAVVPDKYAQEKRLVQSAYIRSAELVHKERGTQAAMDAYQNAIENIDDKRFQARTQLTVARLLFEEEEYRKSAEAYDIYLKAYGGIASRIGFAEDKALFRVAQCYQLFGRRARKDNPDEATAALGDAVVMFERLINEFADSDLVPDALFSLGFTRQLQGDKNGARQDYQRMVQKYSDHPATPSAVLQMARIAYENSDTDGALGLYRSLMDRYPESDLRNQARMELGLTYKRLGDIDAAIEAFEAVESDWSQWLSVQIELSDLYMRKKDYANAAVVVRGALDQGAAESRGQLHYLSGKIHFAEADYQSAIGELDQALASGIEGSIAEGALFTRGASYYEAAKLLDAQGDTLQASSLYEHSLEDLKALLARSPAAHIKDSAFRTLGAGMIRLSREEEAADYYAQLIEGSEDPQERATFQMLQTELYYDMENFVEAEMHARRLLAMSFEDDNRAGYYRKERAYSIIGNSQMQQKNFAEAAETFGKGLAQYPNSGESANLAFSKGFAQFNSGVFDKAAVSFAHYTETYGADRNVVHGRYYLAHSYQALTAFDKAALAFADLADKHPGSTYEEESLYLISENHYNNRSFDRAAVAYSHLLEKYPQGRFGDSAQYALAWSHFEQEDMESGVEAMKVLVERYPDSEFVSKAQFTVGDYYYNIRSYNEALNSYARVANEHPGSPEAAKAEQLVAELSEIQASFEYGEVMKLFDADQYEEAMAGFARLVKKYPDTYTEMASYCNIAMAHENMRNWAEAVEFYDKALEKAGDSPQHFDVVSFARQHREWIVENRL
jgi:tetratricopeptide (TPR) repeat protein